MIKGTIIVKEEPEFFRTKKTRTTYPMYGSYYNDDDYLMSSYTGNTGYYEQQKKRYDEIMAVALAQGYIMGARVKRTNGNPGVGTITNIFQHYTAAKNYQTGAIEPFQVTWDNAVNQSYQGLSYALDELILVEDFQPLEGKQLEVLSNLHVAL